MKVRICFKVTGKLSYISHLDFMRLWQRALIRTNIALEWTNGFNPRPKMSLGPARGVGIRGLKEYLDVSFEEPVNLKDLIVNLNEILPKGMEIIEVRQIINEKGALDAIINEANYDIIFNDVPSNIDDAIKDFLDSSERIIERKSPKGSKQVDLRKFVYNITRAGNVMKLCAHCGNLGSLRPMELVSNLGYDHSDVEIIRTSLMIRKDGVRINP